MSLVNCQKCGKAFGCAGGKPICPECREKENQNFEMVREYVRDHPGTPVDVVADETGIPSEKIRAYLNEGLLSSQNVTVDLKCQLCERSISSGNYCINCMDRLKKGLKSRKTPDEPKKKETKSVTLEYLENKRK